MESMSRANWTDERLDDFARNTDRRFDEVERRFDGVDRRIDSVEASLRELRTDMNAHSGRMETRFDDLYRAILQVGAGMFVTIVIGFAGLIVA
jgi:chromosome segregation ATPase